MSTFVPNTSSLFNLTMGNLINKNFLAKKIITEMKKDYLISEEKNEFNLLLSSNFWNMTSAYGKIITYSFPWMGINASDTPED